MASNPIVRALGNGLSFAAGTLVGADTTLRVDARRRPYPTPHQFASLFDHPLRLRYRNPGETLGLFGLAPGMTVLDLGCGTGLFTEEMARLVGGSGTVHGVDIQLPLVKMTRDRVQERGLGDRCHVHHAGAYALPLESESIDIAVMIAVLGEIPDRLHALLELFRVLKPGGRLAVSEELLHPAYMTATGVRRFAEEAGFQVAARTGNPFVYTVALVRP
ncbi:MAG: class I SAM-dependent methyltransferase [Caldilineaceae bacterium]